MGGGYSTDLDNNTQCISQYTTAHHTAQHTSLDTTQGFQVISQTVIGGGASNKLACT